MKAAKAKIGRATKDLKTLAIDIGGTGIKAIVLDEQGKPVTERGRLKTPRPATPRSVLAIIKTLAKQQGVFDRVSVGFPGGCTERGDSDCPQPGFLVARV